MATTVRRGNSVLVQYQHPGGTRKTIYLGKGTKAQGKSFATRVDELASSVKLGQAPSSELSRWISELEPGLRKKLENHELIEPAQEAVSIPTVDAWFDSRLEMPGLSSGSVEQMRIASRDVCSRIGDKQIDQVTAADAQSVRSWLKGRGLAENTIRRRIGRAKQFFRAAMLEGFIKANPFEGQKVTVRGNSARDHYVPRDVAQEIIDSMECPSLKAILAMTRFGAFRRCEALTATWSWFDFESGSIRIDSPKTGVRLCPLFPDLALALEEIGIRNQGRVQTRYEPGANPVTTLKKKVIAAGHEPWPKLLQNCRVSQENDLLDKYPARSVASWVGHSETVQRDFYRKPSDEHFKSAAKRTAISKHQEASASISSHQKTGSAIKKRARSENSRPDSYPARVGTQEVNLREIARICELASDEVAKCAALEKAAEAFRRLADQAESANCPNVSSTPEKTEIQSVKNQEEIGS